MTMGEASFTQAIWTFYKGISGGYFFHRTLVIDDAISYKYYPVQALMNMGISLHDLET